MMFRERLGKHEFWVLCIRTTYDPATKRGKQDVVAKFRPYADELPSDVAEALTPEERDQATQWIADRRARNTRTMLPGRWQQVVRYADELSSALENDELAPAALERLNDATLYASIDRLTRALRKRGRARPTPAKKAPAEADSTPLESAIAAASRPQAEGSD